MTRHFLPLLGMAFAAAITVAVLWFALALLLSFGTYIETVLP